MNEEDVKFIFRNDLIITNRDFIKFWNIEWNIETFFDNDEWSDQKYFNHRF